MARKQLHLTSLSLIPFIFILIFNTTLYSQTKTEKENLEKKKKQIENEIQKTNNILIETKKTKTVNINQLNIIQKQISNQNNLINVINSEIKSLSNNIEELNSEILKLQNELAKLKNEYAKMIYYSYLTQNSYQKLLFIVVSQNINEAFLRMHYFNEYASSRRRYAELIIYKQNEIQKKINSLNNVKQTKFNLLKEEETEVKVLNKQKTEKNIIIDEIKKEEKKLKAELKKKQEEALKLQRKIEELIRKEIEEANKKTGTEKKTGIEYVMTAAEIKLSNDFIENKGKLPWPVDNGIVTGKFGEQPHPVLTGIKIKNNGIDINVRKNSTVKPIFSGSISAVFILPNQTRAVIVRHGEYLTVYTNLSSVNVKKGEKVDRNTVLGTIYTSSSDNSTIMHFELWRETKQEDPELWLRKVY